MPYLYKKYKKEKLLSMLKSTIDKTRKNVMYRLYKSLDWTEENMLTFYICLERMVKDRDRFFWQKDGKILALTGFVLILEECRHLNVTIENNMAVDYVKTCSEWTCKMRYEKSLSKPD